MLSFLLPCILFSIFYKYRSNLIHSFTQIFYGIDFQFCNIEDCRWFLFLGLDQVDQSERRVVGGGGGGSKR